MLIWKIITWKNYFAIEIEIFAKKLNIQFIKYTPKYVQNMPLKKESNNAKNIPWIWCQYL